ncbi:MAG: glycosyltransferase family 9 protein [Planctomycetes bacterium]|nr:glycosyltransferase family 9 protein [Planctomycetota bacterium]
MASEERILLIRLSHMGDVVHALPVFHALRRARPAARLAWAVEPAFAGLLEGLPGLERVVLFQREQGAGAWPRLAAELSRFAPTWSVDAQGNLKSAAVSLCAGSARRSGLHPRDWRERLGAAVLHDSAPAAERPRFASAAGQVLEAPSAHAVDRMLALARHVGGPECGADFDLALGPGELERGALRLAQVLGSAPGPGDVLLLLSAPGDVRSWPLNRWGELARALARRGRRVLLLGGPAEEAPGLELARELRDLPAVRAWVPQRGLRELAACFSLCAQAGARAVGVDSGPLHLAAASGLCVVVLEGPQSHWRTGPWPPPERETGPARHGVVRSSEELPCAPCFSRVCRHPEGPVCMTRLGIASVLEALERPLRDCPVRPA